MMFWIFLLLNKLWRLDGLRRRSVLLRQSFFYWNMFYNIYFLSLFASFSSFILSRFLLHRFYRSQGHLLLIWIAWNNLLTVLFLFDVFTLLLLSNCIEFEVSLTLLVVIISMKARTFLRFLFFPRFGGRRKLHSHGFLFNNFDKLGLNHIFNFECLSLIDPIFLFECSKSLFVAGGWKLQMSNFPWLEFDANLNLIPLHASQKMSSFLE